MEIVPGSSISGLENIQKLGPAKVEVRLHRGVTLTSDSSGLVRARLPEYEKNLTPGISFMGYLGSPPDNRNTRYVDFTFDKLTPEHLRSSLSRIRVYRGAIYCVNTLSLQR